MLTPAVASAQTGPAYNEPALLPASVIYAVSASPPVLGPHGGIAQVHKVTEHSATCQLKLLSHQSFPVVYATNARSCTGFSPKITVGANPTTVERTVAFELVAKNGPKVKYGRFYITLLPKVVIRKAVVPKPATKPSLSISASATSVYPGGTITFTIKSTGGLSACVWNTSDYIDTIPADAPSNGSQTITFTGQAVGNTWTFKLGCAYGPTNVYITSNTLRVTVAVAPTSPPPTSLPPAAPTGPVVSQETSKNWSGYQLNGGPFTSLSGTFNVPSLTTAETCQTATSEWAGIDGGNGQQWLIQAGVTEDPTGDNRYPCAAPKSYYNTAWYEVITPTSEPPATPVPLTVRAGDSVTVKIAQLEQGVWYIIITDDTTGQSYSTEEDYSGPGQTAEWVTEDTGITQNGNMTLADFTGYTPAVRFSSLTKTGPVTSAYGITMQQDGANISIPSTVTSLSQLLSDGFTTTFEP